MSLLEYGRFKRDVDFTDADFLDKLENANNRMKQRANSIKATGKKTDTIRKQNEIIDKFYDEVFGDGSAEKMFGRSQSALKRTEVYNKMLQISAEQAELANTYAGVFRTDRKRK